MLDLALTDIRGHKLRSSLTVLGIVLAIAAVVSLGGISEGLDSYINNQLSLLSGGIITITEDGSEQMQGPPTGQLNYDDVKELAEIDGVERVAAMYFGTAPGIFFIGVDFEELELMDLENIKITKGVWPEEGEYGIAVGYYNHDELGYDVGDSVIIEDETLTVTGIVEQTDGFMDFGFITSIQTIQEIYEDPDHVTAAQVKVENVDDAEEIAEEIESLYPTMDAATQKDNIERAQESIQQTRAMTLGIGLVAAIVAAIGIINTMIMSVSERKKQIGIMKATGATDKAITRQILEEAVVLSIPGGILGIVFGVAGIRALNYSIGFPLAQLTPTLAISAMLFSVGISLMSAYYPAKKAAEIDPIVAIKGY